MINFRFGTNGKLIILGVPILKHITVTPTVHKTIYSDRFIWDEKAFLICQMDLISD